MRKKFADLCIECERGHKKDASQRIRNSIKIHQQELELARASFLFHSRVLSAFENMDDRSGRYSLMELGIQHYRRQFQLICENPKVQSVNIEMTAGKDNVMDPILHVFTCNIMCKHPKSQKIKNLGRWMISFNIRNGMLRWEPLDYKPKPSADDSQREDTWRAPHINEKGGACYGDSKVQFDEFYGQGRFANSIALAIRFLECINPSDKEAVKTLDRFPTLDSKE